MNIHMRHRLVGILLAGLVLQSFAMDQHVKVNGKDLREILHPGQLLIYTNNEVNNVALKIEGGSIETGVIELSDNDIQESTTYYNLLELRQHEMSRRIATTGIHTKVGVDAYFHTAYISGGEYVKLDVGSQLDLKDAILKSKEILTRCSKFCAHYCFVDTNTFMIHSNAIGSLIKAIRFTFTRGLPVSACVEGILDFARNETLGGPLLAMGAQKVEIEFSPEAFK